jgi:hypothetical protein
MNMLSPSEFSRWQEAFHSRFWNGLSYDHRHVLAERLKDSKYRETGVIFATIAGINEPSTVHDIFLNNTCLIDAQHQGVFAAIEDCLVILQGDRVYKISYKSFYSYVVKWEGQKIRVEINTRDKGILSIKINTWITRNIFQRLLENQAFVDSFGKWSILQKPLQEIFGKDVNPKVVEMYEDFRRTLASFLNIVTG